jgi:hypothetical protein
VWAKPYERGVYHEYVCETEDGGFLISGLKIDLVKEGNYVGKYRKSGEKFQMTPQQFEKSFVEIV